MHTLAAWICSAFLLLTAFAPPPDPPVDLGADTSLCEGDSLLLRTGVPNASYLWQDGSTDSVLWVYAPGLYWAQVTRDGKTARDSILIGYLPRPVLYFPADTTLCEEAVLNLNVSTLGSTYLWQDGSSNPRFQISEPGLYHVSVTNRCGRASDTIEVSYIPVPKVSLGRDTSFCEGQELLLDVNYGPSVQYLWDDGSQKPFRIITESGRYYVAASNACGTFSDTLSVEVPFCDCKVFLANAFSPNGDGYNEYFQPIFDCAFSGFQLQIYDRWGRLLFQAADPAQAWDGTWQGQSCPAGVYVWVMAYDSPWSGRQLRQGSLTLLR